MKLFLTTLLATVALSLGAKGGVPGPPVEPGESCSAGVILKFQRLCSAYVRSSDTIAQFDNPTDWEDFYDNTVADLQDDMMIFTINLFGQEATFVGEGIRAPFTQTFGSRTFQFVQLSDFEVDCEGQGVQVKTRYHGVVLEPNANFLDVFGDITCSYNDQSDNRIDEINVVRNFQIDRGYGLPQHVRGLKGLLY